MTVTSLAAFGISIVTITGFVTGVESPSGSATEQDVRVCNMVHRPQAAMAACTRLIKKNGLSSGLKSLAYTRRGQVFARSRQFKKALSDFSGAITLNTARAEARFHRGAVYSLLGNHDRAILDYTRVIALEPDYTMAYYNRGTALARQGNHIRAIPDFSKAIAMKPSLWRAYVNRGVLYLKTGEAGKALADYDKAFSLNPRAHEILINRAGLHLAAGRKKQAFHDYRTGLKLPDRHGHVRTIQQKLKKQGFYQGAVTGTFDDKTEKALRKWLLDGEVIQ